MKLKELRIVIPYVRTDIKVSIAGEFLRFHAGTLIHNKTTYTLAQSYDIPPSVNEAEHPIVVRYYLAKSGSDSLDLDILIEEGDYFTLEPSYRESILVDIARYTMPPGGSSFDVVDMAYHYKYLEEGE